MVQCDGCSSLGAVLSPPLVVGSNLTATTGGTVSTPASACGAEDGEEEDGGGGRCVSPTAGARWIIAFNQESQFLSTMPDQENKWRLNLEWCLTYLAPASCSALLRAHAAGTALQVMIDLIFLS